MTDIIAAKLDEIEKTKGVKILFACEAGSRAWGFASTDSDYDVRFIYIHPLNNYLSIREHKNIIEPAATEMLDIGGWDIKKALSLMLKNNASVYEWLQSPIIYRRNTAFHEDMLKLAPQYFSPRPALFHYLGLTTKSLKGDLQGPEIKMKKYFYGLRPVLAAKWIVDKRTIPPMEFDKLRVQLTDAGIQATIDVLVEEKKNVNSTTLVKPNQVLHNFITDTIAYCEERKAEIEDIWHEPDTMDAFYRKTIGL